jgi:aldose 1-epimerase
MEIKKKIFGVTDEGYTAHIFELTNTKGMKVSIINYGARVVSIKVPDKNGDEGDVVLGYDNIENYINDKGIYFGAIVGRHANRIEGASFRLNGHEYTLAKNEGNNHLHGGIKGFDRVIWEAEVVRKNNQEQLMFTYMSPDGEEGYPGNLEVRVTYSVTEENELRIDYSAVSDKDTVVNLTNHTYFNLAGHNAGSILSHQLMINGDSFTAINDECIPTGEIREVYGTPMDFTTMKPIDWAFSSEDQQLKCGKGYDHNWVLNVSGKTPEKAAELYDSGSGRAMEVYTTMPGLQFYSGNFLGGSLPGKENAIYNIREGLCLETQYFPNAMKHLEFPSPVLKAGREYKHATIYKFSVREE